MIRAAMILDYVKILLVAGWVAAVIGVMLKEFAEVRLKLNAEKNLPIEWKLRRQLRNR
jgi:hypothetical protein